MRITEFTKSALAYRRQRRDMKAAGWDHVAGPWEIERGGRYDHIIVAVEIATNGKSLYVKTEPRPGTVSRAPLPLIRSLPEIPKPPQRGDDA